MTRVVYGLSWLLAVAVLTVACGPDKATTSQTPTSGRPSADAFSAPLASSCAVLPAQTPLAEVKGSHLWALVFGPVPIKARTEIKIVWRMGGQGAFTVAAKTTDGTAAQLTIWPTFHPTSDWNIPNTDEWGTGFIFPTAGCWRAHAWRDGTSGDVYFLVV